MKVYHSLDELQPKEEGFLLTVGTFDGVHRGHQYLLTLLVAHARACGCESVVLTFHPHPRQVLYPEGHARYLCSPQQREERIAELGVDHLIVLPFTQELASQSAREFVGRLRRSGMRELWVGEGFRMGRGRTGTAAELCALGREMGFRLRVVRPLRDGGEPISSTRIRWLLEQGDVAEAARLLGWPVALRGVVVPGEGRGQRLGFPTANLPVDPSLALPQDGVYAVWVELNGQRYRGVANLGPRPSFDSHERLLEAFVIDHRGDLYGQCITVEFVRRLRDVRRFEGAESLVRQIAADVEHAEELLGGADRSQRRVTDGAL